MAALELRPFGDEFLDRAADLLALRHRRHRAVEPLLPPRFEDPTEARPQIAELWGREEASGAVALEPGGRLAGFLIGTPRAADPWGANVWVELAGHATMEPEAARDLYGAAAQRWVDEGRTRHYVVVPAGDDELVGAWFNVGFGLQQALAVREVPAAVELPVPDEIVVREATDSDVGSLVGIGRLLPEHHRRSPVFSTVPAEAADEADAWRADVLDQRIGIVVAERDGSIVGAAVGAPVELSGEHSGLGRPDGACILAFAATDLEARGTGVGCALTRAVFDWAHERGYEVIVTDWRATNLQSSRFWPRRGFRTAFLRLYRSIP
jgi:predicted N-acetyltransferase YhbS